MGDVKRSVLLLTAIVVLSGTPLTAPGAMLSDAQDPFYFDLWDVRNGTTVTGHSPFDQSPPGLGYDGRDVFGAGATTYAPARGTVVFDDGQPTGYTDFITWQTLRPSLVTRFNLFYSDDSPAQDWRNLAHFSLLAQDPATGLWVELYSAATPQRAGQVMFMKSISHPFFATNFQAQLTRGSASDPQSNAPRINELDAYGQCMPDADVDGKVGFTDLVALAQNFGRVGVGEAAGDFNADGRVGFPDLLLLSQHYGQLSQPATVAVPEPASSTALAAVALLARRRREKGGRSRIRRRSDHATSL